MVRCLFFVVAVLAAAPALAQGETPPNDDRRYQFNRVDDGHLRLDLRTGQVSLCRQRPTGWACTVVADDRVAFDDEIARLQAENATLKKALLDRGLPLPRGADPGRPSAKGSETAPKPPETAEIDRMMSAIERMWRRLIDMIVNMQNKT